MSHDFIGALLSSPKESTFERSSSVSAVQPPPPLPLSASSSTATTTTLQRRPTYGSTHDLTTNTDSVPRPGSLNDTLSTSLVLERDNNEHNNVDCGAAPPSDLLLDHHETQEGVIVHLLRYALIFINMMLVLAAMLLVVSGTMFRANGALSVCEACGGVSLVPIVLGGILWLLAMAGFYAARVRNVTLLLVYGAYIIVMVFCTVIVLIVTGVYAEQARTSPEKLGLGTSWAKLVRTNPHEACSLQTEMHCSGYKMSCNSTAAICPSAKICKSSVTYSATPCKGPVEVSVRQSLLVFLIMIFVSITLIVAAVVFAWALNRYKPASEL
eukprot:PhM_4_TR353/c0_g2_i1/m.15001